MTLPSRRATRSLYRRLFSNPFICSSCKRQRDLTTSAKSNPRVDQCQKLRQYQKPLRRFLSSITPVTTVNATRTIPELFRELHDELGALETRAGAHVNLSQLQLALRGLESTDAVIRVAGRKKTLDYVPNDMELTSYSVLGINGQNGAHRLAKVLLADPLVEEQAWEKQLVDSAEEDGRALLIRSVCRCL